MYRYGLEWNNSEEVVPNTNGRDRNIFPMEKELQFKHRGLLKQKLRFQ